MLILHGEVQTRKIREALPAQQKHTNRIIINITRLDHTAEIFKPKKILNVFMLTVINFATVQK